MSPLTHEEIQELLGAYALDAVDPDEAELIERHLEACPRCRAEVEGHREVATMLGNTGGDAPDGLWDRIAEPARGRRRRPCGSTSRTGPATVIPLAPRRARSGATGSSRPPSARPPRSSIAVLGAQVVRQQDQLDDMESALEETTLAGGGEPGLRRPRRREGAAPVLRRRVAGRAVSSPTAPGS